MSNIEFSWDRKKAESNFKKHGVSFEEAQTVFYDENARCMEDSMFAVGKEERFLLLGLSSSLKILVVCHCYRKNDSLIRIISARKATSRERKDYQEVL